MLEVHGFFDSPIQHSPRVGLPEDSRNGGMEAEEALIRQCNFGRRRMVREGDRIETGCTEPWIANRVPDVELAGEVLLQ